MSGFGSDPVGCSRDVPCPQCGGVVEIWSDEIKRRCPGCNTVVFNHNPVAGVVENAGAAKGPMKKKLNELRDLAKDMGSDDVAVLPAGDLVIDPYLAGLCLETRCPAYGQSPTCPPHVEGPDGLKAYMKNIHHLIFLKLQISQEIMHSHQSLEVGKLLHFIVIQVEQAAREMGFSKSRAFAGGSCKQIFCREHPGCRVLTGDGQCRNPDSARPSVSGFGININHLVKSAAWGGNSKEKKGSKRADTRYGLILIG